MPPPDWSPPYAWPRSPATAEASVRRGVLVAAGPPLRLTGPLRPAAAPGRWPGVGLVGGFVAAPAAYAGEPHGDAALVAAGALQPLKGQLKHLQRLHGLHRPKPLGGVAADPAVQGRDLLVVQARIGLGEAHQLCRAVASAGGPIPQPEGVVGEQVGAAAAAGLGIEQHRIQAVGIALVFPPVTPPASGQVGQGEGLQHQPLGAGGGGLLAQGLQLLPAAEIQTGGEAQAPGCRGGCRLLHLQDQRLQGGAALAQGPLAPVVAPLLQQVVGHERRRALRQQRFAGRLAAQAPLQLGKRRRLLGAGWPHQDFAVEHGALRQGGAGGDQLGEGGVDQLLAPALEEARSGAADQLAADAVVLPLRQPVERRAGQRDDHRRA